MQPETIRELYLYNHWADQRTLDSAAPLSPENFTREMGNSFSSVRDTLAHILSAEWIWMERWLGRFPTSFLPASDFPTVESLRRRWATVDHDYDRFLQTLTADRLRQPLSYLNRAGERHTYLLWQQMAHVVNHSSYHRGQITTLLRQIGAEPRDTDFLSYYDLQPRS